MKLLKKPLFSLTLFGALFFGSLDSRVYAAEKVAKAIILKGKVLVSESGRTRKLKKGQWVLEGAIVKTKDKSFVKFLFIDKSQMSLGPKSQMDIKSFPKDKAGIINLVKGEVRAKVIKNYLEKEKKKSKLFLKTKTAAMGVRGTDFKVAHNPANRATALVVFEGVVKMTKIDEQFRGARLNQNSLDRELNNDRAVTVRKGEYSGAGPQGDQASPPIKISPIQLEAMKKSTDSVSSNFKGTGKRASGKSVRSIVPPGVDAKKLTTGNEIVEKQIESTLGKEKAKIVIETVEERSQVDKGTSAPVAKESGVRPGGLVDLKTGLYVPPPKGSQFDENTGVYIPPPNVGSFDKETGSYVPPEGYKLSDKGVFEADDSNKSAQRSPASQSVSSPKRQPSPPPPPLPGLNPDPAPRLDDIKPSFEKELRGVSREGNKDREKRKEDVRVRETTVEERRREERRERTRVELDFQER